jgi:choline transport protein
LVNTGSGPALSETIWTTWSADVGYPDGFVFVAGMLNGAFAMGTPDSTTHLAEEIPMPQVNVPKAIAAQYFLGFIFAFAYLITILYAIKDYESLYASAFPIAEVYSQATQGSKAATIVLLVLLLLPTLICTVSLYITCGRTMWTLARVNATPFSQHLGRISQKRHMPAAATLTSAVLVTLLGVIYMGSSTAFNSFIGSFILHSSASYIACVLPYLFRRRRPGFQHGPFHMRGVLGWIVHGWASLYMVVWFIIYCFPYSLPTNAQSMNYSILIWGGLSLLGVVWWAVDGRRNCLWPATM